MSLRLIKIYSPAVCLMSLLMKGFSDAMIMTIAHDLYCISQNNLQSLSVVENHSGGD